jgi:hypothetical protein
VSSKGIGGEFAEGLFARVKKASSNTPKWRSEGEMKIRRATRLLVASALVAGAMLVPAAPANAMAVCQVRSAATLQSGQTNVIVGAYTTAGAADISLTCGIVRFGETVQRFSEKVPGPVAAVEGTSSAGGFFTVCHEIHVTYVDGRPPYSSDQCP